MNDSIQFLKMALRTVIVSAVYCLAATVIAQDMNSLNCSIYRQCDSQGSRYCHCDSLCTHFDDCCPEKVHNRYSRPKPSTHLRSLPPGEMFGCNLRGHLVVSRCSPRWREERTKELCQNDDLLFEIPFLDAPVTTLDTRLTYKNKYCALCNGISEKKLQPWVINIQCYDFGWFFTLNENTQIFKDYLMYNYEGQHWGIWGADETFHHCSVAPTTPSDLTMRTCVLNMIKDCPGARSSVSMLCRNYGHSPVFRNENSYKNLHCALCNEENMADLHCSQAHGFEGGVASFATLTDFSLGKDKLNKIKSCKETEVQFGEKCKSLRCGRNMAPKKGRCIPA